MNSGPSSGDEVCIREALCPHSVTNFNPFIMLSKLSLPSPSGQNCLYSFFFSHFICKDLGHLLQAFQLSSFHLTITLSHHQLFFPIFKNISLLLSKVNYSTPVLNNSFAHLLQVLQGVAS